MALIMVFVVVPAGRMIVVIRLVLVHLGRAGLVGGLGLVLIVA